MTRGEWLLYDAPWETEFRSLKAAKERFVEKFLHDVSAPPKRAIICAKEHQDKPIGWVTRYGDKRFPDAWLIGIDICEDEYLSMGYGTEAFRLWVDYLFSNSEVHRLGFDTYSFNSRMVHVGEKLGFIHEGTEREVIYWQNVWVDRLHFGLLRKEWEPRR
jgi:RimJ/RimL family protein N-acetyltransferase